MHKEVTRPVSWILDIKKELPDHAKQTVYSPLHYGDTIEISFVRGIEGETYINGKKFIYKDKNVFFIPPKYLHRSVYRSGGSRKEDMVCAFHINVEELSPFINLRNILFKDNRTLLDLAFRCDDFDEIWEIVQTILDDTHTYIARIISLLRLLEIVSNQKNSDDLIVEYSQTSVQLIEFVEKNYATKLTIQNAANHFGYSQQYFCKWFKQEAGVTFNEFLNSVRIHHACSCLRGGYSVEGTSEQCGFSDPSYFTKVFKRFVGISPKSYTYRYGQTSTSAVKTTLLSNK